MNRSLLALAIMPAILAGCVGHQKFDEASQNALEASKELSSFSIRDDAPAAVYIDTPQNELVEIPIEHVPDWFHTSHEIKSAGVNFYYLAEELAKKYGLFVKYGPDVDPNIAIHVMYENGTAHGALESLSSSTGYSYDIKGKYINWSMFQVERYDLSYVGGKFNYLLGSDGSSEEATTVTVGSNQDQYQNIEATGINVYEEVEKAVAGILNGVGEVILSESSSSVVVRTTPARMERVNDYMRSLNDALAKQVVLEVKVIKVRTESTAASGIDWSLVKQASNGSLSFGSSAAETAATSLLSSAPTSISLTKTGGSWDASNLLVTALEEQGTVSVVTVPKVTTQVNRVAELEISELQGYIERTEVTPNDNGDPSVSITPGTVRDGYSIFMLANVDSSDRIYLHLSSLLSDLLSINRKEVGANAIETPNFIENKFTQTVILKKGQTLVANGLKQEMNSASAASPVGNKVISSYKSGARIIEETIVLITPTLIDMSES